MRLEKLKSNLEKKVKAKNSSNIRFVKNRIQTINNELSNLDKMKIIGITGSTGKSTTAYIVHKYLKFCGYRSILYSSVMIDSPASIIDPNESCEVSIYNEEDLLSIINEAESYNTEYLVLEINESILEKKIVKDLPFNIRVLTNINPYHNEEQYTNDEYVNIKKSFFRDIMEEDCHCIIGLEDNKELFNEFLNLNNLRKSTFSSRYISNKKNINPNDFTCLLEELYPSLNGMSMVVKVKDKRYSFDTSIKMRCNALNIVCAITILNALDIFDVSKFHEVIKNMQIPGRAEMVLANGRIIVIDNRLTKMLEFLKELKNRGDIKNIKVVLGSMGYGFISWDNKFNTPLFLSKRKEARKYACDLLKKYADYVYFTEDDNGIESVVDICNELQTYLDNQIPSNIILDRKEAIKQAIKDSEIGDVVFISGRGNRKILCNTELTMKLIKDIDVVNEVVKELGW